VSPVKSLQLEYTHDQTTQPRRPLAILGIALTTILAGPLFGASTNCVDAFVSPTYFNTHILWERVPDLTEAVLIQGILEGLVVGTIFSVILTAGITIVTGARCSYGTGARAVAWLALAVYGLWILGGLVGVLIATVDPIPFESGFGAPSDPAAMKRFAWVLGSIWGEEPAGLAAVLVAVIVFRAKWRTQPARMAQSVARTAS
jgi:hypothetical protein